MGVFLVRDLLDMPLTQAVTDIGGAFLGAMMICMFLSVCAAFVLVRAVDSFGRWVDACRRRSSARSRSEML
jgi:hypothetical protein